MTTLIQRLEALDGPDREVDALIGCDVKFVPDFLITKWEGKVIGQKIRNFAFSPQNGVIHVSAINRSWAAPDYTDSVDAALTLMMGRFTVNVSIGNTDGTRVNVDDIWSGKKWDATHNHTAIAICTAAMKAGKDNE